MPRIDYIAMLKPYAQEMRKNMTPQEKHLWHGFLKKYPVQFHRQKQFGRFIVDFYCASAGLVIEVDGGQHYSQQGQVYDKERTAYLNGLGLRVIRFTNLEIDNQFDSVCKYIEQAINTDSGFQHRSLQERAEAYGGHLNLSTEEIDWGEPVEGEV